MKLTRFSHYYLHHDEIDREHRMLYDALRYVLKYVAPSNYPEHLMKAMLEIEKHFDHEHILMIAGGYPFVQSHVEVHDQFREQVMHLVSEPTHEGLEELLCEFLHHIDWYDRPWVDWINSQFRRRATDQVQKVA